MPFLTSQAPSLSVAGSEPAPEWFDLQADSPAINAGVDVGVTEDIHGTSRPQQGGFDVGASEKK